MSKSNINTRRDKVLLIQASKAIRLLFMVLFVCLFMNVAGAQVASSTWVLTSNGNSANVGNVTGSALAIGTGINNPNHSAASGVKTGSWSNDADNLKTNEFYEFKVTPNVNTVFNVTAINFEHSVSNGNWKVQAYYSTDNFATATPIATAFNSDSDTPTANNNTVNIDVDGETLSVRIYGWDSDGSGRQLRIRNTVISGTSCAKPLVPGTGSAYSATCTGFTAQWGYSNQATTYYVDVATTNSFTPATIVPAYNNLNVGNVLSLGLTGLNPGTTYYYRVRASNSCATSSSSNTMSYATSPMPTVAPVAKAATNVQCSYAQLNFSTGANVTGVYLDIARDNAFTDFLSGYNNYNLAYNSGTIPVSNLPAGTLYYRIRGYNSCGVTANSNTISFSTTSPIGGNVSPSQRICSGSSPANLTLTGYSTVNTEILKWQKSNDAAFSSPIDVAGATSTLSGTTIGNLTVNTYFRAVVRNKFGSWCESFSNPVLISIEQAPIVTPNKVNETCPSSNNGTISPTLSGGLTNVRYIKLTQKHTVDAYQQVAEIQAFEIFTGTNVALSTSGAVASASSVWTNSIGPNYIPSNVNNGVITGNTFWHSATSNLNEWVMIDLQSAKNIDYLKIYNRTDCCSERGQNMLLELFDASNNLLYTKTIDLYQSGANLININVLDVSWADGATTLNRTALDSGIYTLNYADALGCNAVNYPITISATNTAPSTPIVGAKTQPDCTIATGSVVLSGLPASGTINQTGTVVTSYPITGATMTISGLAVGTYNFSASIGGCGSSVTGNVVINPVVTNTWTTSWSNGTPNSSQKLVFSQDYLPTNVDIVGCSCKVAGGATVTIKSGRTLTITNEVTVVGGGSLTFENNASLVQINNAATNSGNIIYKRKTASVLNSDYTYWSSPVAEQQLINISSSYASGMFYSFDDFAVPEDWKPEATTMMMQIGKGYIIRGSQTIAPPTFYDATFVGVPNNGTKTISIGSTGTSNLLGNPYPSAINADLFLAANSSVIEGTIYFWTHKTAIQIAANIVNGIAGSGDYAYTSDDYASYNTTGGVGTGSSLNGVEQIDNKPTGKITAGQGFFTTSKAAGTVIFNNSMRVSGNNTQFFKTRNPNEKTANTIEKNRIWLNLTNTQGAFKQTLVGYITDATNEYDLSFDGESFDANEFIDFYSVNQDKNLVIQGRALPFDAADKVPLGFRTTIDGTFTINIDQVDGLLTDQTVFIEDKLTNTVFDLKSGNYTFNTVAGTFNDRFVLKYSNKTLETNNFDSLENKVLVSNINKQIKINSFDETIDKIVIYDLLGRQIYQKTNVNNNELSIANLVSTHQTLVVKTLLQNGKIFTDKIIY